MGDVKSKMLVHEDVKYRCCGAGCNGQMATVLGDPTLIKCVNTKCDRYGILLQRPDLASCDIIVEEGAAG